MTSQQVKNLIRREWDFSKSVEKNVLTFNTKERQKRRFQHRLLAFAVILAGLALIGWFPHIAIPFLIIGALTFPGSSVQFDSNAGSYIDSCALSSTTFVIAYRKSSNSRATAIVGSVAGNVITFGTNSEADTGSIGTIGCAPLDSTHFVLCFQTGSTSYGIVGVTNGGTTISSWGTKVSYAAASSIYHRVAKLDSTHFVVACQEQTGGTGIAAVASVSGTTISFGSTNTFSASTNVGVGSVVALDSTHFVVAFQDFNTSNRGTCIVGVVSGTTISSYGTGVNPATTSNLRWLVICALDSTHFAAAWSVSSSFGLSAKIGTVSSGTTITFGTVNDFETGDLAEKGNICALSASKFVAIGASGNSPRSVTGYYCTVSGSTITFDSKATAFTGGSAVAPETGVCGLDGFTLAVSSGGGGGGPGDTFSIIGQLPAPANLITKRVSNKQAVMRASFY